MKQFIYRLLWLNDERLKRRSKLYALVCSVLGAAMMIGALAFYIALEPKISIAAERMNVISSRLVAQEVSSPTTKLDIELASDMLLESSKLLNTLIMSFTGLAFACGFLILFQGIMYFRIHEVINENT